MRLRRCQITLEPWAFATPGKTVYEIRTTIQIEGEPETSFAEVLPDDDFLSRFDIVWERATLRLKDFVRKEAASQKARHEAD